MSDKKPIHERIADVVEAAFKVHSPPTGDWGTGPSQFECACDLIFAVSRLLGDYTKEEVRRALTLMRPARLETGRLKICDCTACPCSMEVEREGGRCPGCVSGDRCRELNEMPLA